MRHKKSGTLFFLAFILSFALSFAREGSAITLQQIDAVNTPTVVAQTLMPGAVVSNVVFAGDNQGAGTYTGITLSEGLGGPFGIFPDGIILSTGLIASASTAANVPPNQNVNSQTSFSFGTLGDADLNALIALVTTQDAAVLTFDFMPTMKVVTFRFIFASDEYNGLAVPLTNDVFGLFVAPATSPGSGPNIAHVPGTSSPVTVKTINFVIHSDILAINEPIVSAPAPTSFSIEYDGFTSPLKATAAVAPGVLHKVKVAIADAPDTAVDSAVFLAPAVFHHFTDVTPGDFAFTQIEALAASGITAGCGANLFCPVAPITRAQIAVFLETSLGVVGAPACSGNIFADVTAASVGAAFCGFIEDFAARGITAGCGPNLFCPNDFVTRAQMAVFIEKALGTAAAPPCLGNKFSDVTAASVGAAFCGFIEDFAARGITGGCGLITFCPSDVVTRAQMAAFLIAAPAPLLP